MLQARPLFVVMSSSVLIFSYLHTQVSICKDPWIKSLCPFRGNVVCAALGMKHKV